VRCFVTAGRCYRSSTRHQSSGVAAVSTPVSLCLAVEGDSTLTGPIYRRSGELRIVFCAPANRIARWRLSRHRAGASQSPPFSRIGRVPVLPHGESVARTEENPVAGICVHLERRQSGRKGGSKCRRGEICQGLGGEGDVRR
jgi:hypothetical protein